MSVCFKTCYNHMIGYVERVTFVEPIIDPQTKNVTFKLADDQTLWLDPPRNATLKAKDIVLFTHLSTDMLELLNQPQTSLLYLPQELLKLLQKLAWQKRITPLVLDKLKCYPYHYSVSLTTELSVTAFPSDDGFLGATSLLLKTKTSTLGYSGRFITQGPHKNRIKKWKKSFQQADIDLFLLDSRALQSKKPFNSSAKNLTRFFNQLPETSLPAFKLSPFAPEKTLFYLANTAKNGRTLLLDREDAKLLHALDPFTEFPEISQETLTAALAEPTHYALQKTGPAQGKNVFNASESFELDEINADQTVSELKEFVHVIAPQKTLIYGPNELEFN